MSSNRISRRTFVQTVGVAGATVAVGAGTASAAPAKSADEFHGILIDTTRCTGCRSCEVACAQSKGLPAPELGPAHVDQVRKTSPNALTVVNRYATDSGYSFLKSQCMHCNQPGCASVCLTKALVKTEAGPVTWNGNKCMGCRMCMVSCPFDIPKFEYDSWNPEIVKCDLCNQRTKEGKNPACVDACPAKALHYGTRRELLRAGRERIQNNKEQYIDHIYGEHEAGGTGMMYLAGSDFGQLGMNTSVGNEPYGKLSKPFLSAVPLIFAIFPVFMLGLHRATHKNDRPDDQELS